MSAPEFVGWMAYAQLEPFGERQDDWRAGMIASTIANVNRSAKTKAYQPSDFMATYDAEPKAQDWHGMLSTVELLNASLGGADMRQ